MSSASDSDMLKARVNDLLLQINQATTYLTTAISEFVDIGHQAAALDMRGNLDLAQAQSLLQHGIPEEIRMVFPKLQLAIQIYESYRNQL